MRSLAFALTLIALPAAAWAQTPSALGGQYAGGAKPTVDPGRASARDGLVGRGGGTDVNRTYSQTIGSTMGSTIGSQMGAPGNQARARDELPQSLPPR